MFSMAMQNFRDHWQQYGLVGALGIALSLYLFYQDMTGFQMILGVSLISLFLHQFEEYVWPGYFPRMVNSVLFKSKKPDRYPLNTNTAWLINVGFGWSLYLLAFLLANTAVWLATLSLMVSVGNVFAHGLLFNIKGKTVYNPGMFTAMLLFLPIATGYFYYGATHHLFSTTNLAVGIGLGIAANYLLVFKPITALANPKTPYIFRPFH